MEGVTVVTHPLVQHKLTLLRDKNRSTKSFRELCKEIGVLLCYEVTRDLPLTDVEIETPLMRMSSPRIAGKKLVFAPILRAGITFVEGMLDLASIPGFRCGDITRGDIEDWLIVIENRPGAAGNIATEIVVKSAVGRAIRFYWRTERTLSARRSTRSLALISFATFFSRYPHAEGRQ